jgi:hypothetical protein
MNRPPGPHDHWYPKHLKECGGEFAKVSEPEKKPKLNKKKKAETQNN